VAYPLAVRKKAIYLRKKGYSVKEVSRILGIARSTSSLWLRDVTLDKKAKQRLKQRKIYGQFKAHLTQKARRKRKVERFNKIAIRNLRHVSIEKTSLKLLCSFLFWAEGSKDNSRLTFVNSDPNMIATFLKLLRLSFPIEEAKFRACVHIHEYHSDTQIKNFWSGITKIPLVQFRKSYKKPHTKKRKRPGYKGCITIHYYDHKVALELRSFYNVYASKIIGA
jgi:predicted transcriptional regulator